MSCNCKRRHGNVRIQQIWIFSCFCCCNSFIALKTSVNTLELSMEKATSPGKHLWWAAWNKIFSSTLFPGVEKDTQTKNNLTQREIFNQRKKGSYSDVGSRRYDSFVCANSISVRYDEIWNKKERSLKKEPLFESWWKHAVKPELKQNLFSSELPNMVTTKVKWSSELFFSIPLSSDKNEDLNVQSISFSSALIVNDIHKQACVTHPNEVNLWIKLGFELVPEQNTL